MLEIEDLGIISFEKAYLYQQKCVEEIRNNSSKGKLLLLEHPECITAGISTSPQEIDICKAQIKKSGKNILLIKTDRGGKITAHNPGQLTGYPIINLQKAKLSIKEFIEKVLKCVQQGIYQFGLKTTLVIDKKRTGLWVDNKKLCFLGIKISHFVSYHGFTLNVNNDLSIFNLFTPCGIENCEVTSMEKELGDKINFMLLKQSISNSFREIFS